MRLVLFDLDNTLLSCDSDYEWGQFLVDRGVLEREAYEAQNRAFYEQYKAGVLDIQQFLAFALAPLARHTAGELSRWHSQFMQERIRPAISERARNLVRGHLEAGDLCAIITATNSFVTAPIAREFGVEHLIATEPEVRDGRYTGKVSGIPCFREGKIKRLEQWLSGLGRNLAEFAETTCYSDSHNDLPLLERVRRPVAVDPDEKLAARARQNGWPVISLQSGP